MNKCKGFSRLWFLAALLVAFIAGCASNAQEVPLIPDTTAPTVIFTSPANGDVAVPYDRKVSVAFSEAMNPATINSTTFKLTGPGTAPVPGTVATVGSAATFTPTNLLAASTLYTATITTGTKDLAGNALATNYVWTFTTGAVADTIRPSVSFTAPIQGQTAVPVNRIINAGFSEAMDPLSLNATTVRIADPGGNLVAGTVTPFGTSVTFTPSTPLALNTTYTGTVTNGARDLAGNTLASNYVWSFATGGAPDTTRPTVTFTAPIQGAIAVPTNRIIHVAFSEAMDPLTITRTTFTLAGPGVTPVSGTVVPGSTSATFTPSTPLAVSTTYTGTITTGARDLAGNALASNYIWSFTTGAIADTTRPTVIQVNPANLATNVPLNSTINVTFSEAMDPLTITIATFTLTGPGVTPVTGTVTPVGPAATFTPASPLVTGTTYTATITTGAKDMAGNALASNYIWSFTTGSATDTTRPTIVQVNPADLATNVPLNSTINATFSEDMAPLTIITAFQVAGVPGIVTYDVASRMATLTPSGTLAPNTTYTATMNNTVTDVAGNTMANNYVWSFSTGAGGVVPGPINLGSAAAFGIMATSAITNTGAATRINGDVSLNPGSSNGLLPVQVNGTIHINDPVSALARIDLLAAYNTLKGMAPGVTVPGGMNLGAFANGGLPGVLPPGTYTSGSTMLISTPLTLDGKGNSNAIWVFQIGSSLTTTNSVTLINGAQAKNVYWVPTASATVGVGTIFYGNIIAGVSATGQTGAVINGRILAGATSPGTIALDTNTVNVP